MFIKVTPTTLWKFFIYLDDFNRNSSEQTLLGMKKAPFLISTAASLKFRIPAINKILKILGTKLLFVEEINTTSIIRDQVR